MYIKIYTIQFFILYFAPLGSVLISWWQQNHSDADKHFFHLVNVVYVIWVFRKFKFRYSFKIKSKWHHFQCAMGSINLYWIFRRNSLYSILLLGSHLDVWRHFDNIHIILHLSSGILRSIWTIIINAQGKYEKLCSRSCDYVWFNSLSNYGSKVSCNKSVKIFSLEIKITVNSFTFFF